MFLDNGRKKKDKFSQVIIPNVFTVKIRIQLKLTKRKKKDIKHEKTFS